MSQMYRLYVSQEIRIIIATVRCPEYKYMYKYRSTCTHIYVQVNTCYIIDRDLPLITYTPRGVRSTMHLCCILDAKCGWGERVQIACQIVYV